MDMRPDGSIEAHGLSLRQLINQSYKLPPISAAVRHGLGANVPVVPVPPLTGDLDRPVYQAALPLGLPDWADTEKYDLVVSSHQVAGQSVQEKVAAREAAFKHAVDERFRLKVHKEIRAVQVLALERAEQSAFGLRQVESRCAEENNVRRSERRASTTVPCQGRGRVELVRGSGIVELRLIGAPLSRLAGALWNVTNMVVLDHTGLKGNFDGTLSFAAEPGQFALLPGFTPAQAPSVPTLGRALQEQLGLKLVTKRDDPRSVEVFVVDQADAPRLDD